MLLGGVDRTQLRGQQQRFRRAFFVGELAQDCQRPAVSSQPHNGILVDHDLPHFDVRAKRHVAGARQVGRVCFRGDNVRIPARWVVKHVALRRVRVGDDEFGAPRLEGAKAEVAKAVAVRVVHVIQMARIDDIVDAI